MTIDPPLSTLQPGTRYVTELDAFRFFAIFSVLCLHWLPETAWINRLQGQLSNGVHLFFVLSGYLITGILLNCRLTIEQGRTTTLHSLRQFYIRRILRIFPVYDLVLIIGVLFHFQGVRSGVAWHASYLSNVYFYRSGKFIGPASLFWTLAVEEQFYLVWPFVIFLLPRRWIFPGITAVAILGTVCRVIALLQDSHAGLANILTPQCMNFLAVGAMLAAAESPLIGSPVIRRKLLLIFTILIALCAVSSVTVFAVLGSRVGMISPLMRAIDQPMMSLVYACLFARASDGITGAAGAALRFPAFVYLGRISYGIYIYHLFVSFSMKHQQPWVTAHAGQRAAHLLCGGFIAPFLVTTVVASMSWFWFEKPLNDLKRFFPYAPPRAKQPKITPGVATSVATAAP